jgi:hypothetical protein
MKITSVLYSPKFLKTLFGIGLFIVLCLGGYGYKHITELNDSINQVQRTYDTNLELEQILSYMKDAETGQRGFLIAKDSVFLKPYFSSRQNINNSFAKLKELKFNSPKSTEDLKELNKLINQQLNIFTKIFKLSEKYDIDHTILDKPFFSSRDNMDLIRIKISEMIYQENKLLVNYKKNTSKNLENTPLVIYSILILTLLLVLFTYIQINKDFKDLKDKNEKLEVFKESTKQSEIVSKHGSWTWDIDRDIFEYSDNLYRLLGEQPQSFEAKFENFVKYVHPEDVIKLHEQVEKMKEEKNLPFIYYRIIQKNGNIRHFKAYAKIVVNLDSNHKKLLGTTTDITEEIESFKLLEDRNLELERNNKELSSFNYVASHDLQEPLRKIQTFVSRLEDTEKDNLSSRGDLYLDRIKNAATRMRSLIDDLLQYSRTNKAEKVLEKVDVNILLENAKQDLAEVILEKNAVITSDTFPVMKVIPFQVQQLFFNLIGNSIKYSSPDKSPVIKLSYDKIAADDAPEIKRPKYSTYHKIEINDNGIGFDPEYSEKIFELFSRLHNKDDFSGTGIGLSICKKIVENHEGFIFANSVKNVGSTFTFYLPLK